MPPLPQLKPLVIGGNEVDGRTIPARRYRAIAEALAGDLDAEPTTAQWLLIQRAAALSVQCESFESKIVNGEECDSDRFVKLTGALKRLLDSLGTGRRRDGSKARVVDAFADAVLSGESGDE